MIVIAVRFIKLADKSFPEALSLLAYLPILYPSISKPELGSKYVISMDLETNSLSTAQFVACLRGVQAVCPMQMTSISMSNPISEMDIVYFADGLSRSRERIWFIIIMTISPWPSLWTGRFLWQAARVHAEPVCLKPPSPPLPLHRCWAPLQRESRPLNVSVEHFVWLWSTPDLTHIQKLHQLQWALTIAEPCRFQAIPITTWEFRAT